METNIDKPTEVIKAHNFLKIGELEVQSHDLNTEELCNMGLQMLRDPIIQELLLTTKNHKATSYTD